MKCFAFFDTKIIITDIVVDYTATKQEIYHYTRSLVMGVTTINAAVFLDSDRKSSRISNLKI